MKVLLKEATLKYLYWPTLFITSKKTTYNYIKQYNYLTNEKHGRKHNIKLQFTKH